MNNYIATFVRSLVRDGKLLANYADPTVRNRGVEMVNRARRIARRFGWTLAGLGVDL